MTMEAIDEMLAKPTAMKDDISALQEETKNKQLSLDKEWVEMSILIENKNSLIILTSRHAAEDFMDMWTNITLSEVITISGYTTHPDRNRLSISLLKKDIVGVTLLTLNNSL